MKEMDRRSENHRIDVRRENERRSEDRRINLPGDWSGVERRSAKRRDTQERRAQERRETNRRRDQDIIDSSWPLVDTD